MRIDAYPDPYRVMDRDELMRALPEFGPIGSNQHYTYALMVAYLRQNARLQHEHMKKAAVSGCLERNKSVLDNGLVYEGNNKLTKRRERKYGVEAVNALQRDFRRVFAASLRVIQAAPKVEQPATPTPVPVKAEPKVKGCPARDYANWSKDVARPEVLRRSANGEAMTEWGYRKTFDGVAMLNAGVPIDGVKDSVTMDWSDEARKAVKVKAFDYVNFGVLEYLMLASKAKDLKGRNIPLAMIGGAGVGKSWFAEELANQRDMRFGSESCNGQISIANFRGRQTVDGFHESELTSIFTEGGVFLLDEFDGMDSNTALVLNEALAGVSFAAVDGKKARCTTEDVVFVANMNTAGHGANGGFGGREAQDGAILDRFACGRIRVGIDLALEERVATQMIGA